MSNIIPSDWRINSYNPGITNEDIFGSKISTDYQVSSYNPILTKKDIYGTLLNDPNLNPVNVTDPSILLNKLKGSLIDPSKITPRPKLTFSDKFANSTFGKNFGAWSAGLDAANNMFTGIFGEKNEYSGLKGNITRAMDTGYDAILNAASKFGPYGLLVSLGMGANKLLGNVANKLGAGTDGMCVCAGTKVFKANGELVNIEDLKQEDGIIGWNEKTKQIAPQTIHDIIEPRLKECLEIIIKAGYTLRCSIDHPILSDNSPKAKSHRIDGKRIAYRDWKFRRADELKVGDFVGIANNIDYWGNKQVNEAYLIGLLIGDGTYTKGSSCRLISADKSTWDYIESNNLGVINHCNDSRPDKYSKEVRTYRIIDGMDLMRLAGIVYLSGSNKTLPSNIGEYTKNSICNLIAGLYDTDGSISVNEEKENWSITLYLSNRALLLLVKELLHKLGIFANISERKAATYLIGGRLVNSNKSYRLEVGDMSSAIKFALLIPLNIDYKKDNLNRVYNLLKDKKPQEHPELSGAKLFKIIEIRPIGILTVYNLLADNDHTYIANGIITHNTNTDAILGSAFLLLTPVGLINGIGGKKANTITKNNDVFLTIGASYGGTNATVDDSLTKSGKKYGLFSGGARKEANALIAEAKRLQSVMEGIADTTTDRFNIRNSMAAINGNRKAFNLQGGYDLSSIRVGKKGLKLSPKEARRIAKLKRIKKIQEEVRAEEVAGFLSGGTIQDPFNIYLLSLPENQRDSTYYRIRDYWEFNGRPKNFEEALSKKMFSKDKLGFYHAPSVSENPKTGEIEFMKIGDHSTKYMELDWYEKGLVYDEDDNGNPIVIQLKPGMAGYDDWKNFTNNYELIKSGPYWKYVKRTSKVTKHELGGSIKELVSSIKPITPDDILEFLNGGTIISPISYMADGGLVNKKPRTLEELIKYAKELNPRFILRLSEEPRGITFTDDEGNEARGSHYLEWSTDDKGNAIIYPRILENDKKELLFFNYNDAYNRAIQNKNFLIMSPEEAEIFFSEDPKYGTAYKSGWPQFFNKFEKGGSINVIPEGALHARKHNMDMEGITKKGIPVVSNNGELQAEIEREEIIYRLEVTLKLEELMKKYYSEDTSKKEKDELALEAGKLLTQETLYNTLDNTNNLI